MGADVDVTETPIRSSHLQEIKRLFPACGLRRPMLRWTAPKRRPGEVRDAILQVLSNQPQGVNVADIRCEVAALIGEVPSSSVRSYLQLNTPELFVRMDRAQYALKGFVEQEHHPADASKGIKKSFHFGDASLILDDCMNWLGSREPNSIHAVVTDR